MTTENDELNIINTNETKEEINNEQIIEPIMEKPKRAGRKKRDVIDNFKNDDNMIDTQPLFEQPVILEGKRSRKPTARLELSDLEIPKKELSIPQGHGKPLGEIEYINYQITNASNDVLSRMCNICFGRRASKTNIRKNLQDFNGFEFERDSDEYQRHLSNLIKLKKDQLITISDILGLSTTDSNNENAEKILNFLMTPIDEGKKIPERKMSMRPTKPLNVTSKESIHIDDDDDGNELEEKIENGEDDDDDDDDYEVFNVDDEEEDEGDATDDDYIGSDEEGGLNTKDDPDDFVYQPGKKAPKKRTSIKRTRSRSTPKRKRGASTTSKRGRKKSKIINKKIENENLTTISTESMQINKIEDIEQIQNDVDVDNDDLKNKLPEQNTTSVNLTDIIPANTTN